MKKIIERKTEEGKPMTSLWVKKETLPALEKLKVHRNEAHWETVEKAVKIALKTVSQAVENA